MVALHDSGWIPYDSRNDFQKRMSDNFVEQTPVFGEVNRGLGDLPETALLYHLEKQATGGLMKRYGQYEGSCVGVAWARAVTQAICGDRVVRNTGEKVVDLFPFATWGYSRKLAGLNRRGAGSFGSAMAKAGETFGMIAIDDPLAPKASIRYENWIAYSADIELDWSVPRDWPVPEAKMMEAGEKHQVGYVVRVKTLDDLAQAAAQGRGITLASMFGTKPKVVDGVLTGSWNDSWAHQMSCAGYYKHPKTGRRMWPIDNQWWPGAHGTCPYLSQLGVYGSFSISDDTMAEILKSSGAEVYIHSDTEDWEEARVINWDFGFGS